LLVFFKETPIDQASRRATASTPLTMLEPPDTE
jgi:hypothetical protein